ncbi:response regulator [Pseudophaeobacter leonis]|uniref:response regulator n=1 Tax=Pseudophaeobacter leonis TaxID=1144477 RepID=UPI00111BE388|nr:response regulator [Pseudophaeobacter leonis]
MKQLYIADDNTGFSEYIATVASREGWLPVICVNGQDLVEQVASGSGSALLIVDIYMPEMDGIEAIEGLVDVDRQLRLRFIAGGADAPFLAAKMIAEARNLSVERNIFKPLGKNDLIALLEQEARELGV